MAERRIGEVARLAHVSVRTLHHYDHIGLLRPSGRSESGYRLYCPADLDALQEILLYRQWGLPLAEIRRLRSDPNYDRRSALLAHRESLEVRLRHLERVLDLVDRALAAPGEGEPMSDAEKFEGLGDFDPSQYDEEVKQRWGHTEAYAESMRRTRTYGKEQWEQVRAEGTEINEALAGLLDAGVPSDDPRVRDLAERHRLMIDRWFYACGPEMHQGLGEMYVADPRFAATYEKVRPGLAAYLRDAIIANSARASQSDGF